MDLARHHENRAVRVPRAGLRRRTEHHREWTRVSASADDEKVGVLGAVCQNVVR